jgi:hypothetical protein
MTKAELEAKYPGLACVNCSMFQEARPSGDFQGFLVLAMTCVAYHAFYPHIIITRLASGGAYIGDSRPDTCRLQYFPSLPQT